MGPNIPYHQPIYEAYDLSTGIVCFVLLIESRAESKSVIQLVSPLCTFVAIFSGLTTGLKMSAKRNELSKDRWEPLASTLAISF